MTENKFLNTYNSQLQIGTTRININNQRILYLYINLDDFNGVDLSYFGPVINKNCWLLQTERCTSWSKKTTVNVIQNVPLSISVSFLFFVTFILCLSFNIQMSKISFLIDPQPEECSQYVLKILVNLSLSVLIKKGSYKKQYNTRYFS